MTGTSKDAEKALNDVVRNSADEVEVMGRKWHVRWIRPFVRRKLTRTLLECKQEDEVLARCAAYILLDSPFKVWAMHWWMWRRLWGNAREEELLKVVETAKKKADLQAREYLTAIIYLTGMKDTMMQTTREEAERTLQGLRSAHRGG